MDIAMMGLAAVPPSIAPDLSAAAPDGVFADALDAADCANALMVSPDPAAALPPLAFNGPRLAFIDAAPIPGTMPAAPEKTAGANPSPPPVPAAVTPQTALADVAEQAAPVALKPQVEAGEADRSAPAESEAAVSTSETSRPDQPEDSAPEPSATQIAAPAMAHPPTPPSLSVKPAMPALESAVAPGEQAPADETDVDPAQTQPATRRRNWPDAVVGSPLSGPGLLVPAHTAHSSPLSPAGDASPEARPGKPEGLSDRADVGGRAGDRAGVPHSGAGPLEARPFAAAPDQPVDTRIAAAAGPAGAPAAPASAVQLPPGPVPARADGHALAVAPGRFGRDLGVEISHRVLKGDDEITIRLDPAELGRVEVRLSIDRDNGLKAVVSADNPAVLDLMRREAGDLVRALGDAGVRSDSQSLRFDARDGGSGQGGQTGGQGGQPDGRRQPATPWFEEKTKASLRLAGAGGQIDMMA
ncbi:flagellar hook-length control protein FliK [Iodidimonas sp. SYSU 1G8]|uniref:flagellar hook-length control protein FliK n=1 Tax=Iodidimonas sp. SYSU 1G8 TaxID=3133967 RepID=UPI0031FE9A1B